MKGTSWKLKHKIRGANQETYYLVKAYNCKKYSQSISYILSADHKQREEYSDKETWRFNPEFSAEEIERLFEQGDRGLYEIEEVKEEQ